nr:hypothetical protein [Koleobacter methoxysyntrophicus]
MTEGINPETSDIDTLSTVDIIKKINHEDKKVALAVEKEIANIAKAVDIIFSALSGEEGCFTSEREPAAGSEYLMHLNAPRPSAHLPISFRGL